PHLAASSELCHRSTRDGRQFGWLSNVLIAFSLSHNVSHATSDPGEGDIVGLIEIELPGQRRNASHPGRSRDAAHAALDQSRLVSASSGGDVSSVAGYRTFSQLHRKLAFARLSRADVVPLGVVQSHLVRLVASGA